MAQPLLPVKATDISYPTVFVNGQTLPASQLNANFNAITAVINSPGSLTNANISASAAISLSKIDLTSEALLLRATGNPTWASGITGDTQPRIAFISDGYLAFGAGSASVVDTYLKRLSANNLAITNVAGSAFGSLKFGSFLLSDNTNTLTFAPTALGSDRAITVSAPGAAANLDFRTGSLTNHGVIVTDGTNYKSTAAGTTGQVLKATTGSDPTWGIAATFGGDGSDGAVTASSNGTDGANQYNYTTYQINDAVTRTRNSGTIINCTSTCIIGQGASGTLSIPTLSASGSGAAGSTTSIPTCGGGPDGGNADTSLRTGGYGGGGGRLGGNGGGPSALVVKAQYHGVTPLISPTGSGGGGGGYDGTNAGGAGGLGGGRLTICAVGAITISAGGTISGLGGTGGNAAGGNSGGGGGGSGAIVLLASQTSVTNNGTITLTGGTGGNGAGTGGGGGGGGGGQVVFWSPSNTTGTVTSTTASGGTGGTTTATAGQAPTASAIAGTPNLPLLVWLSKPQNLAKICALPSRNLKNRDIAAIAAEGDICKYFAYMSGSFTETCEAIGDIDETLPLG